MVINAIAITPLAHASAEDRLGLAIYPQAAMLNHACMPNVAAAFTGRRLHIHAVSDLAPGTTLRFCYGPQVVFLFLPHILRTRPQLADEAGLNMGFDCLRQIVERI